MIGKIAIPAVLKVRRLIPVPTLPSIFALKIKKKEKPQIIVYETRQKKFGKENKCRPDSMNCLSTLAMECNHSFSQGNKSTMKTEQVNFDN